MKQLLTTAIGKLVRSIAKARGGGSALPGLVVERIDKGFLARTLGQLPRGFIVISGSNGKTTTAKILIELLESQGLKVFANRTGSNFTRGIVASLLGAVNLRGQINADIGVLEVDEAYTAKLIEKVHPNYSLLLNIVPDQLDRFTDTRRTTMLLQNLARATKDHVVVSRDDTSLSDPDFINTLTAQVSSFGNSKPTIDWQNSTTLESSDEPSTVPISFNSSLHKLKLNIPGSHNALNLLAALAMTRIIIGDDQLDMAKIANTTPKITPADGRSETIMVAGKPCLLTLVKNPTGLESSLAQLDANSSHIIALNDKFADGRDVSWIWATDLSPLVKSSEVIATGHRAGDVALCLYYNDIAVSQATASLPGALQTALDSDKPAIQIFASYTAMLELRNLIMKLSSQKGQS